MKKKSLSAQHDMMTFCSSRRSNPSQTFFARVAANVSLDGSGHDSLPATMCKIFQSSFWLLQKHFSLCTLFRNKRLGLNKMFQHYAPKFAKYWVSIRNPTQFFHISFCATKHFPLQNAKYKVACNEKQKDQDGFSYTQTARNFEAFHWNISLSANLLFLKNVPRHISFHDSSTQFNLQCCPGHDIITQKLIVRTSHFLLSQPLTP